MPTQTSTIDFLLDQLQSMASVRARKMFGEYALYCDEKVVALVCDDQLFVKITPKGKELVGKQYEEGEPYPGAKPAMLIPEELLEDRDTLCDLVQLTADNLPQPKPKVKKR